MSDYSLINEASVPSIVIWEQYLVYAIPLGVAEEVIKQLKVIIPAEEITHHDTPLLYSAGHGMMYDSIKTITNNIDSSLNSVLSVANSSNSSSSGSGGGFSSGGGGGGRGGGGGGGGAF